MIMRCAVPRILNTTVKIESIQSLIIKLFTNLIKLRPRILIHVRCFRIYSFCCIKTRPQQISG